jgi:hypothetical protein
MPHDAWLVLIPAVKRATELGLFGDWRSVPFVTAAKQKKSLTENAGEVIVASQAEELDKRL